MPRNYYRKTKIHSFNETLKKLFMRSGIITEQIREVGRSFRIPESLLLDRPNNKPLIRRPLFRPDTELKKKNIFYIFVISELRHLVFKYAVPSN